jgi:hypothetical protein
MRKLLKIFSLILMLVGYCGSISAQLVDIESQRLRNDTTRIAGVAGLAYSYKQSNDLKITDIDASLILQVRSKNKKDILLLLGNYELLRTSTESLTNTGFGHIRFTHKFNSFFRLEAFSQYQTNENLHLKNRYLLGFGPRLRVFNRKNADSAFGCLYMAEWEEITEALPETILYHRLSSYLSFNFVIKEDFCEITSITYYQPLITDFGDYRLSNNTSLHIKLFKNLGFETGVKYSFDSQPPLGVINNSFSTTMGVKYKF